MQTLGVATGEGRYPVHVGPGLLDRVDLIVPVLRRRQVALVTNTTVAPLYLERLAGALAVAGVAVVPIVLPDGEEHKHWQSLNAVFDALLAARCGRDTTLIALGGGVVGDLAGFAAACYQRGVSYIQVPTTLLAQVDSSVGGKTAINHPLGKNMIGAFHQPRMVLADTDSLKTLPLRELRAGLAEVIKHGLIRDADFFAWIEANLSPLLACDAGALTHAIVRSIEIKAEFVQRDEREQGVRALLNFGHTFGHAIEAALGYGQWLHGEAIATGMVLAADLSAELGHLPQSDVTRIRTLLQRAGLPTEVRGVGPERMRELMGADKKARDGRVPFVILERVGLAAMCSNVEQDLLARSLGRYAA